MTYKQCLFDIEAHFWTKVHIIIATLSSIFVILGKYDVLILRVDIMNSRCSKQRLNDGPFRQFDKVYSCTLVTFRYHVKCLLSQWKILLVF